MVSLKYYRVRGTVHAELCQRSFIPWPWSVVLNLGLSFRFWLTGLYCCYERRQGAAGEISAS